MNWFKALVRGGNTLNAGAFSRGEVERAAHWQARQLLEFQGGLEILRMDQLKGNGAAEQSADILRVNMAMDGTLHHQDLVPISLLAILAQPLPAAFPLVIAKRPKKVLPGYI